tara:strand:- start:281 stop:595 length:315 start_codon:yes stop_codon:yes gene_type:complete
VHVACKAGSLPCLQLLLSAKADVNAGQNRCGKFGCGGCGLGSGKGCGYTALHTCADNAQAECAALLIESQADPSVRRDAQKRSSWRRRGFVRLHLKARGRPPHS